MSFGPFFILFTLIDHNSSLFLYFLKSKDDVGIYLCIYSVVENQIERKIKGLRAENAGEYCNKRLERILKDRGNKHQLQ